MMELTELKNKIIFYGLSDQRMLHPINIIPQGNTEGITGMRDNCILTKITSENLTVTY